ncbi:MAG: hypothetical protein QNJ98_01390 [Planctomycetota bacterium]|nr:hypothetical protein [Planctomycetota bacterium]
MALLVGACLVLVAEHQLFGIDVQANALAGRVIATGVVWMGFVLVACTWPLFRGLDKLIEIALRRQARDHRREGFEATAEVVESSAEMPGCGCVWMLFVIAALVGCVLLTKDIWTGALVPWS